MAYYKYHNTVLPELPKSNLPYVALSVLETGNFVIFSSEPFVAIKDGGELFIPQYIIYASVPSGATKEAYMYDGDKTKGWVKSTSYTSSVIIDTYLQTISLYDVWCNAEVAYESGTVVYQPTGDPVLYKESFPIKGFAELLISGLTNNPLSIVETIDSIY